MRSSYLWAGLIAVSIGGWFAFGNLEALGLVKGTDSQEKKKVVAEAPKKDKEPFLVEVVRFSASVRNNMLHVRGRTEAKKQVAVLARTSGIVEDARFEVGDKVNAGDLLCRLDMRDRKARLAQAKAQLASVQRDFDATGKLLAKKYASKSKFAAQQAQLDAAAAGVEQIKLDISYTRITAPISGIITGFPGKKGSFLQPGRPCATISTFDPLLVTAQVSERAINSVKLGQKAVAKLVTGSKVTGEITYIAQAADVATRTFKVEITVANPGSRLRAGVSADVLIPLEPVKAHLIPSGIIGLNDKGQIGVRTVVENNKVRFVPVRIIAQTREGTWVSGLPETVTIITVGQDYVLDGETVRTARREETAS